MRSGLFSILPVFFKALSLCFCCIQTVVGTIEEDTCADVCLEIFNGLRVNHGCPIVKTLKREDKSNDIASVILNHASAQPTGFGVKEIGQYQFTYAKIGRTADEKVEEQVLTQFIYIFEDAIQKKTKFSSDPTSIFPDFTAVSPDSVIILDEHLYSHNQLFGQDNSFSLGWTFSESHVLAVVVSEILRVTKQDEKTSEVFRKILSRSLENNLNQFVLQFQATSLAQRILSLDAREGFKGLIDGPGFQASIQIESFNGDPKISNVLAKMLEEIQTNSKYSGGNPKLKKLGDMFPYVFESFSSEDYQALCGTDDIGFGVYENEKRRISLVLYFNTFTKTIGESRKRFCGTNKFKRLRNVTGVKQALKWIGNNVFQNYSSGFGIFDEKYALSFLKCIKTETYQFGMEKKLMNSMLESMSNKDARKKINLNVKKIQVLEHSFTLLCEGNSVADLAQIIATSTTEITPAVIEIGGFYVAVLVTPISLESSKNLPIFVLDVLQKEAEKALRGRMQAGLKIISGEFMRQTLSNLHDIKTELKIIDEKCDVRGIAIQQAIQSNDINTKLVIAAVSIKSFETLSKAVSEFPEVFIDCGSNDGLNFVTTIVVYTHPALKLFKNIKNIISGLGFSLSLPLTSWATDFAKQYEHMKTTPATFGLTQDNHIVSTIDLGKLTTHKFIDFVQNSELTNAKCNLYKFNTEAENDYRVIYDRTTTADLFQVFKAQQVGVAQTIRQGRTILIFAYDASTISLGCMLPLINSYRLKKKIKFSELKVDANEGLFSLCAPDLSRSPTNIPGLIIHDDILVTYEVMSDTTGVGGNCSLVKQIFDFANTILSSNENETYADKGVYFPWIGLTNSVKQPYSFLVPNENLAIQKKLISDGTLLGMNFREQGNGLRSIQIFYAKSSNIGDHDDHVGITLANTGGVMDATEYNDSANDSRHRNRIAGSTVRSLSRKQWNTPAGYIVLEGYVVAFAKITQTTSDRVELAKLVANSLMNSKQPLSVVEASTATNSKTFEYKYTIITGSGETFARLVDSAKDNVLGFAYTSGSDCMVGAFVFNLSEYLPKNLSERGFEWHALYSLNFLANEIAATWAGLGIPQNFTQGNITVRNQEFISVVVICETVTKRPETAWLQTDLLHMIETVEKQALADPIRIDPPTGLTGNFKAGGPPTFILQLKDGLNLGVGGAIKDIGDGKFQCYLVILLAAN